MTTDLHTYISNLGWLPEEPASDLFDNPSLSLIQHASLRPNWVQGPARASKLAGLRKEAFDAGLEKQGELSPINIWLLGNVTLDFLQAEIVLAAPRHGFVANVQLGPFDQMMQTLLNPGEEMGETPPDVVMICVDVAHLAMDPDQNDGRSTTFDTLLDHVKLAVDTAKTKFGASVVINNIPEPLETVFGALDAHVGSTPRSHAEVFETELRALDVDVADFRNAAASVGLAQWRSPRFFNKGKFAFDPRFTSLAADVLLRPVAARFGKSRRVLVLDLDNTLWGGVVGDDGPENVLIGSGTPEGEAYQHLQRYVSKLRAHGTVLAVSSKNTHETAIFPFRSRTEMVLKEDDFAAFHANWRDKASNIEEIAKTLGLGLSSFVFCDDNPAERALVRSRLPQVAVPELPEDPHDYAACLSAAGYFTANTFSQEDKLRASDYRAIAKRKEFDASVGNIDTFLSSLEMQLEICAFKPGRLERVTDLFNKTNQFNLTLERFSKSQIAEFADDTDHYRTYQLTLSDKFGDMGLVSVVLVETAAQSWHIRNWAMSCRVLGRKVEDRLMQEISQDATKAGARKLTARFMQGPRNDLVSKLYPNLGFTPDGATNDGAEFWTLAPEAYSTDSDSFFNAIPQDSTRVAP